jgi:signal transduction histidine kinase
MDTTETKIYYAVVAACVATGIIILYFFISVIRHQRENLAFRKKSMLREITGLEKERARIASDLHDELGPLLSTARMRINSFVLTEPNDLVQLEKTNGHIDTVLKRMREISFNLMPNILLRKGLVQALSEYMGYLDEESEVAFIFVAPDNCSIDEDKAVNIYRIVQELVYNAVKHSGASEISVELRNKNNKIHLKVSDNGKGFDYTKKLAERSGIGLGSLSHRTAITGGKMFMESGPENGTTYIFEIPL